MRKTKKYRKSVLNRAVAKSVVEVMERRVMMSGTELTGTVIGTTGSYKNHGTVAADAFDNNLNTYFDAPLASGSYAGLDLGVPQAISQVSFAPRSGWASRMVGGVFQGSNKADFSSGVVTLATVTKTPATGVLTTIPVSNTNAFEFVRYLGPANSYCDIAEAQFYGVANPFGATLDAKGNLLVNGTTGTDTIQVEFMPDTTPSSVSVNVDGQSQSFSWASVKSLVVNSRSGTDGIQVGGTLDNSLVFPPMTISAGDGNDTIHDSLNADISGQLYDANTTITAGNGNDTFTFDGNSENIILNAGDGNNQFTSDIYGDGNFVANLTFGKGNNSVSTGTVGASGYQNVTVTAGTGQDTISSGDPDDYLSGIVGGTSFSVNQRQGQADIIGKVYADLNGNNQYGGGEPTASNSPVTFSNNIDGTLATATDSNGNYGLAVNVPTDYNGALRTFGQNGYYDLSNGELLSGIDIALPQPLGGTVIGTAGSYKNSGTAISKAFDGSLDTYVDGASANGNYAGRNLGTPTVISSIAYAPRSGWASRMVGGIFQGSNSPTFSNAVNLFTITSVPNTGVLTSQPINNSTAFQYVRYLSPNGSYGDVAEVQFFSPAQAAAGGNIGSNGLLTVTGTSGADNIHVAVSYAAPGEGQQTITVTVNQIVQTFDANLVKGIIINSGNGDDTINVDGSYQISDNFSSFDPTADLSTTINAGNGNDTINSTVYSDGGFYEGPINLVNLGSGTDHVFIEVDGSSTVNGGAGSDFVTGESVDGLTLTVNGGAGNTTVYGDLFTNDVFHGGAGVNTYVEGPDVGEATLDVNLNGPTLTNIQNYYNENDGQNITVEAGSTTQNIVLDGGENSATVTGGSGNEYINVVAQTALVNTGNGSNTVQVNAAVGATVNGGIGNDTIYTAAGNGPATINGAGGTNTAYTKAGDSVSNIQVLNPQFTSKFTGTLQATAGSYQNDGNSAARAVDGNLSTYFDGPTANSDYVGLDLGSYRQIGAIAYAPRAGWAQRMVGGTFEVSATSDFSRPVPLFTITAAPVVGQFTTYTFATPVFARYVRYVAPDGSFGDVAELQILPPAPAGTGAVLNNNGILTVTGTSGSDTIGVNIVYPPQGDGPQTITVNVNNGSQTFDPNLIKGIVINSGDGNDTITAGGYYSSNSGFDGKTAFDPTANLAMTINTGNGNNSIVTSVYEEDGGIAPSDIVNLGNGTDSVQIIQDGSSTVNGGGGTDYVDGNASDSGSLYANGGSGDLIVHGDGFTTDYVHGGTGINTFIQGPDHGSFPININLNGTQYSNIQNYINSGSEDVNVTATNSSGEILINGGSNNVTVTGGNGNELIQVINPATAQITTGNGNNSVYVQNSFGTATITGGSGNDTIYTAIGSDSLTINGGGGTNTAYTKAGDIVTNVQILNPTRSVLLTGTLLGTAGSYQNDGNTAAKAVDGNLSTYFDGASANGQYVGYDLGTYQLIGSISFAPRATYPQRMVGGIFQTSDSPNFSNPTNLYTISSAPAAGVLTTVQLTNPTYGRYVRYLAPYGSFGDVSEIQFYSPGTAGVVPLNGVAIGTAGSYRNHGTTITNAFDGNLSTYFDGPDASGDWVGLDLGNAKVATQVSYAPRAGYEYRMTGGMIQGSNSSTFSSGVVTLLTIGSAPTAGVLTTHTLSNAGAFRYYRYIGPANSYCDIAELQFAG